MVGHPLFDFGESDEEKHEKELQRAFNEAYQKYVQQGGRIYDPLKRSHMRKSENYAMGGHV